jgi:hypothetical protein
VAKLHLHVFLVVLGPEQSAPQHFLARLNAVAVGIKLFDLVDQADLRQKEKKAFCNILKLKQLKKDLWP